MESAIKTISIMEEKDGFLTKKSNHPRGQAHRSSVANGITLSRHNY